MKNVDWKFNLVSPRQGAQLSSCLIIRTNVALHSANDGKLWIKHWMHTTQSMQRSYPVDTDCIPTFTQNEMNLLLFNTKTQIQRNVYNVFTGCKLQQTRPENSVECWMIEVWWASCDEWLKPFASNRLHFDCIILICYCLYLIGIYQVRLKTWVKHVSYIATAYKCSVLQRSDVAKARL